MRRLRSDDSLSTSAVGECLFIHSVVLSVRVVRLPIAAVSVDAVAISRARDVRDRRGRRRFKAVNTCVRTSVS